MASVTVIFGGHEQKTYPIDKSRIVVGREPKCDIHIDNLGISREHCAFSQRGDAYLVQDLNSSNGTYVNGRKITEHFLNHDDEIVIGKYMLKFRNEAQAIDKPKTEEPAGAVPDTLNTYVMDGPKIQQQLEKMRKEKAKDMPADMGPAAPPKAPHVGATARDYARAMDVDAPKPSGSGGKVIVIVLVLLFLLLLLAVCGVGIWYFVTHRNG